MWPLALGGARPRASDVGWHLARPFMLCVPSAPPREPGLATKWAPTPGGLAEDSQAPHSMRVRGLRPAPPTRRLGGPGTCMDRRQTPFLGGPPLWAAPWREGQLPGKSGPQPWGLQSSPRRVLGCLLRATQHLPHPPQPIKNVPAVGGVKIEADTWRGRRAPPTPRPRPPLGPPPLFLFLVRGLGARPLPARTRPATEPGQWAAGQDRVSL